MSSNTITTTAITVQGTVADGYERVREEFAAFVAAEEHDPAAQLAAYKDGRLVVDLWAGDVAGDSLSGVFSTTKGAAYLVVALLVQDGVLDLDRQVAYYWPEFAAQGKGEVTLRQLLTHRSGAIGADDGFTAEELADDRVIAERLAGRRPFWKPGVGHGYHALTIGALTGEVVLRATGRTVQEIFEERVRAPYGLDFFLGLPEAERSRYRDVLPMLPTPEQEALLAAGAAGRYNRLPIAFNTSADPSFDLVDFANSPASLAKGPASVGGAGNARGIAGMYAAAIGAFNGRGPLLTPETVAEFTLVHSTGPDLVLGEPSDFALGFQALGLTYPWLGANTFGHSGAAGSLAFGDPRSGLAYGYTRRRFAFPGGAAPENERLARAVYEVAIGQ
ncbi:class A beta-lactamase-related serine hydrolase [Streptomyces sp. SDr-06]|uniref:serine hydrolase domain-containing protein n=1 Tax=Streptomyces sp. SDr-06 TaxID=2267702 RepID=UPI000DEB4096|nr:serine hydrolase domain-containing protein [Streptomyces sp. SDr-06]RCH69321.1 class A beta-lactamase-related serine hydrolase [Streptomyces sp. SDr-06]